MKKKTFRVLDNVLFVLVVLLVFFALFESRLEIPAWLQPVGRAHPLILHFPIVLLLLYAVLELFKGHIKVSKKTIRVLLLTATLTALLTAIAGLFLSKESGYDSDALSSHKWWGVAAALLSALAYYVRGLSVATRPIVKASAVVVSLALIIAGHLGSAVTHGNDFLFEPLLTKTTGPDTVSFERAVLFDHVITPVFEAKCNGCHNPDKKKGQLDLTTQAGFLKGGEDGKIVIPGQPRESKLIHVINLPLADDDHMPPEGKAQLTRHEMLLLDHWVRSGAPMDVSVHDSSVTDSVRLLADAVWKSYRRTSQAPAYAFRHADPADIEKLNTPNRAVVPVSAESPALKVIFYNKGSFTSTMLKELNPVRKNVVELDLHNMPVQDADMKTVSEFENLRLLNLNYTAIGRKGLEYLKPLRHLERLSLSGTAVSAQDMYLLSESKSLKEIFVWNTLVKTADVGALQNQFREVTFQTGFEDDGAVLKLPPPRVVNDLVVFSKPVTIELSNPINGTEIRYTVDGSDIDSVKSPVYTAKGIRVSESTEIRAQAFRKGWAKSDVITFPVVRSEFIPDSTTLAYAPNPRYKGRGAQSFFDQQLAEPSLWHPGWVGFYEQPMELVLTYKTPVAVSTFSISCFLDIGSYIFPPEVIEVWGGSDLKTLKQITSVKPQQPVKYQGARRFLLTGNFKTQQVSVLKIIARPVRSLPRWHAGKGQRAHLFVDEVGVN